MRQEKLTLCSGSKSRTRKVNRPLGDDDAEFEQLTANALGAPGNPHLTETSMISTRTRSVASTALTSLKGLEAITSIGGNLLIQENDALTSLEGLKITSIGGLTISNNAALTSLDGLESITSVGGHLEIVHTDILLSLAGLSGITAVGGHLLIKGNDALTSLDGLKGITAVGQDLEISSNGKLPTCAAEALKYQLKKKRVDMAVKIEDNGKGRCSHRRRPRSER